MWPTLARLPSVRPTLASPGPDSPPPGQGLLEASCPLSGLKYSEPRRSSSRRGRWCTGRVMTHGYLSTAGPCASRMGRDCVADLPPVTTYIHKVAHIGLVVRLLTTDAPKRAPGAAGRVHTPVRLGADSDMRNHGAYDGACRRTTARDENRAAPL